MIIEFQPPCYVQGRQPSDQAAQSHIQPGHECLQGWGIHSLLGQPVPVHHHPPREKLTPNIQSKPPLSQFKTILPCPITIHPRKQPFLSYFYTPFKYCIGFLDKNAQFQESGRSQEEVKKQSYPYLHFLYQGGKFYLKSYHLESSRLYSKESDVEVQASQTAV